MTTAIANELIGLEKQYWQAIQDRDAATVMRLSDEQCIVAGAQGVGAFDRQTLSEMLQDSTYRLEGFSIDEAQAQVRQLSDDVAVVAYKVTEKLTVEGKPLDLEAYDTSVWWRRGGQWVCVMHTESLTGNPFGRK
jgi:ketosteroid isomerase-like protein